MEIPEPIKKLATELAELPGIGPRQALRIAFYLVHKGRTATDSLADSLSNVNRLKDCEKCFLIHNEDGSLCSICASCVNGSRNEGLVMIVEKETDLVSLEKTGSYKGRYLVLGDMPRTGALSDEQRRRLATLGRALGKLPTRGGATAGKAEEVILAFNPTGLGDFHASLVTKELAPFAVKITRLGRGLPSGGEIEFADDETLGSALAGRK